MIEDTPHYQLASVQQSRISFQRKMFHPSKSLLRSPRRMQEKEDARHDQDALNEKDKLYVDENCQVSNDPPENGVEIPDLHLCHINQYKCPPTGVYTDTTEEEIVIPYQYELHYNPAADFDRLLSYLEEASLEHLAAATGTADCNKGRRRLALDQDQKSRFLGVSKNPPDQIDARFAECSVNVVELAKAPSECVSMLGGFTIFLTPKADETEQERLQIHQAVKDVIRQGMEDDLYTAPGNIEKVVYIENRTPDVALTTSEKGLDDSGSLEGTWIGLIAAAATLLVLVLLAAVFVARRKRNKLLTTDSTKEEPVLSLDGSLAEHDSLALQPQLLMDIAEEEEEDGYVRHKLPSKANDEVGDKPTTDALRVVGRSKEPFVGGQSVGGVSTRIYVENEDRMSSPRASAVAASAVTAAALASSPRTSPPKEDYPSQSSKASPAKAPTASPHKSSPSRWSPLRKKEEKASKFSDLDSNAIAEAESQSQTSVPEPEPRPVMMNVRTYDTADSVSEEDSLDDEESESSSECTPRRILQMT